MLYLLGINHRTADLATREKLWLSDEEIRTLLSAFHRQFFEECFIVSTCNRTELYGVPLSKHSFASDTELFDAVERQMIAVKNAGEEVSPEHFYRLKDMHAAKHLMKVATGLDSMVLGDVQILNQLRQHYYLAAELKTSGAILNKLLQTAFHAGKRTKSETKISKGAVSVSYAAIDLAAKIFFDLGEKTALLIGAGETGELTARHLVSRGIGKLLITNRTLGKAETLAAELRAAAIPFDRFNEHLHNVDIVISSVNSTGFVLSKTELDAVFDNRKRSPLLIVDIGVPRNIDPEVNSIENVFLHDMDTLSRIVQQSLQRRHECIPEVNEIILDELTEFHRWHKSHAVAPILDEVRAVYESIRNEELIQHIHKFRPDDKELVEHVTKRIIHRLMQLPASELRNGKDDTPEQKEMKLRMVRKLFGLNGESHSKEKE